MWLKMLKKIIKLCLTFIVVVLIGTLTMFLTYCIPISTTKNNVFENIDDSFKIYQVIPGFDETIVDISSDAIIMGEVAYIDKTISTIENSMLVYSQKEGAIGLRSWAYGGHVEFDSYTRYWHGYLPIIKPLFLLFNYNTIKVMQLFFQLILLIVLIKLMKKNKLEQYIVPFIISIALIHPEVIGQTFQYSSMYNLMLISTIILLKYKDNLIKKDLLIYYFLIVGMITSFVDFLTYPAITFGVPILFYILLQKKNIKSIFIDIIKYGLLWVVGYFGMWFSKWVIASLVLHQDIIGQSLGVASWRTSTEDFTRLDAIIKNIAIYSKKAYVVIFLSIAIYYCVRIVKNRNNITKEKLLKILPLLSIALIPFAWYFVISNHSYIHYWMTYRELLILFLGITFSAECLSIDDRRIKNEKRSR